MVFSKSAKITHQQGRRNWTDADIQSVLDSPALTLPTIDYSKQGTPDEAATVYYRSDGHYVIRNDATGEIIQLSDRTDPNWYDEHRGMVVAPVP